MKSTKRDNHLISVSNYTESAMQKTLNIFFIFPLVGGVYIELRRVKTGLQTQTGLCSHRRGLNA